GRFLAGLLVSFRARLGLRLALRLALLEFFLFPRQLELELFLLLGKLGARFGLLARRVLGFLLLLALGLGAGFLGRRTAQLGDLALRQGGIDSVRELLDVELEIVRVVAVLDGAPELELDFLVARLRAGLRAAGADRRRRPRLRRRAHRRRGHLADDSLVRIFFLAAALERAPQRDPKVLGGLVARFRVLRQRLVDHRIEVRRHRVVQRGRRGRIFLDDLLRDGPRTTAGERLLAGEELVQDDAGREYVAALVDRAAGDLLGRHVRGRADHRSRLRALGLRAVRVLDSRYAEVGELGARLRVEHHVRGLDVAVDDARVVREVERIEQLAHDAHCFLEVEALVRVEEVLQLLAANELHDQVGDVAFLGEVVHLDDVRMVEPRDGLRLARKPHRVVFRGIRVQMAFEDGLDRDPAIEFRVDTLVDHAHGALTEHALDVVAPEGFQFCFSHPLPRNEVDDPAPYSNDPTLSSHIKDLTRRNAAQPEGITHLAAVRVVASSKLMLWRVFS